MTGGKHTYPWYSLLLTGLITMGAGACSSRPSEVLSDKDAASLLADLHIADSYAIMELQNGDAVSQRELDSVHKVIRQSVMASHGVSEAQLDTTLGWYGHNLDKYEEMYEIVLKNIEDRHKNAKEKAETKAMSPTLWPYGNTMRFSRIMTNKQNLLPFEVDAANIAKGSRVVWEAKTLNATRPIEVFMAVEYADGSIGYIQRNIMGEGRQTVVLQTDSAVDTKRLYGYLRTSQPTPLLLDSVSLTATPLNTTSYYEIHSAKRWKAKK